MSDWYDNAEVKPHVIGMIASSPLKRSRRPTRIEYQIRDVARRACWHIAIRTQRFTERPSRSRWIAGVHECCWTYYCGHDLRFAVRIGNIYWKVGRHAKPS